MGFFQELIFTAFLAIILSFVVAKVVSKFAVSNSSNNCNTAVCPVDEGVAAKEETLSRELRVGKIKGKKRVRFVDDEVVIKRVDHYEGSENLVFCEDVNKIGDDGLNEDLGGEISKEQCFDMREMHNFDAQDKGCEKMDWGFEENEKILENSKMESVILEDEKNEVLLESENIVFDQNDGNGLVGTSRENNGLNLGKSCTDLLDTKECSSCHISSNINHDPFVGSREDEGLIAENPSIDSVLNDEGSGSCHISCVSSDTDVQMYHNVNPLADSKENDGIFEGDVEEDEAKVKDENVECEDDDWEGIERSELEKAFAEAVNYVEYDRLAKLGSDVQMQLYGLHKVAVEGACYEPPPMALKVSARAKWNSWQRLGNTSQEVAMEQYIKILEDNIPGWMTNHSSGVQKLEAVEKISVPGDNSKLELNASVVDGSSTEPSTVEKVTAGSGDSI